MPPKPKPKYKRSVLSEEGFKKSDGGIYAYMPFENLDKHKYGLFKIGLAESLEGRLDGYHSYYPLGVYLAAILKNPRVPRGEKKSDAYKKVEKFIHSKLEDDRTVTRIYSTTRNLHMKNDDGRGRTDWFYASMRHILDVFDEAQEIYGGEVYERHLDDINKNYKENKAKKHYEGKIVYQL